jgi:hypothetical protein
MSGIIKGKAKFMPNALFVIQRSEYPKKVEDLKKGNQGKK